MLCNRLFIPLSMYELFFYAQSAKLGEQVNGNLHHLHTVEAYSFCAVEVHAF